MAARRSGSTRTTSGRDAIRAEDDLQSALLEFRRILRLCRKNRYSLVSHPRYADRARQGLAALRKTFLVLERNYPEERFPGVAYQLATIQPAINDLVKRFPDDMSGMLTLVDDVLLKVEADLAVELEHADQSVSPAASVSFLPAELIEEKHGVLAKVLWEVNRSYDTGCYNSAASMARRLVESLIIEAYVRLGCDDRIKANGEYLGFQELVGIAVGEGSLRLTREAKRALPGLKFLGDMGAHNRNALVRKDDLDRLHDSLRIAVEEISTHLG